MKPVKRNYAFEDASVPHGEQWMIKVRRRGIDGSLSNEQLQLCVHL